MDILTLGKMNQMAKDLDLTMEFLANSTFETLKDICGVQTEISATQAGQVQCLDATTQSGVDALNAAGGGSMPGGELYVYNPNHWSITNGGASCAWTVPEGVKSLKFEVLGGGGPGGSSGGDYDAGIGGQGGHYTSKVITKDVFTPGVSTFTVCAGGTSNCDCCCSCNRACRHGCTSYVTGDGLSNLCALGGSGGSTNWDMADNCYNCHIGNAQCDLGNYNGGWVTHGCNTPTYGGDVEFRGTTGSYFRQYNCCATTFASSGGPTGPFAVSGTGIGKHWCTGNYACCSQHSAFPGGGGGAHQSGSGTGCTGGFGAGGLVKITWA
mgnify:CR=1 FL=1